MQFDENLNIIKRSLSIFVVYVENKNKNVKSTYLYIYTYSYYLTHLLFNNLSKIYKKKIKVRTQKSDY